MEKEKQSDIELEASKKEEFIQKYKELSEEYGYALDISLTVVKLNETK